MNSTLVEQHPRIELHDDETAVEVRPPRPSDTADFNHTDVGNGERLAAWGRDRLRYVHGVGFHVWDDQRWRPDAGESFTYALAKHAVRGIYAEQAFLSTEAGRAEEGESGPLGRKAIAAGKHAVKSEAARAINAMIQLGRSEPGIVVQGEDGKDPAEMLDADSNLLNVQNGVMDLDTFELLPHDPQRLITKIANASYFGENVSGNEMWDRLGGRAAPTWQAFLETVLPDEDLRRYVQKAVGYSMLGSYSEWLFVAYGAGANGKSTFLNTLRDVLGDYAQEAPPELLMQRPGAMGAGELSALARMRGARLVTAVETEQNKRLSQALVKQLTGEHAISTKLMRQDYFTYTNQTAVWLATNHRPVVQGVDHGIWRRLRLVPFEVKIPEVDRIEPSEMQRRLRAERSGILRWAVEGLRLYRGEGLDMPENVRIATEAYRKDMDPLEEWLGDCCALEPGATVPLADLRRSYEAHCEESGRQALGGRSFNEQLEGRGCERARTKSARLWKNIKLVGTDAFAARLAADQATPGF